jgi:hypothetical protein
MAADTMPEGIRRAAEFIDKRLNHAPCDRQYMSECVRCNALNLARYLLQPAPAVREALYTAEQLVNVVLDAEERAAGTPALHPTEARATPAQATATPEGDALPESWECFRDVGRFDMWCVRPIGSRKFGEGFHVARQDEAHHLRDYLNAPASPPAPLGEAVAFRYLHDLGGGRFAWTRWLEMSDLHHYGPDGNLISGPHPDWQKVEYAYAPQERQEAQGAER